MQSAVNARQTEITGAIGAAETQLAALVNEMAQLRVDTDQNQGQSTESIVEALQRSEEEQKTVAISVELLQELLQKSKVEELSKAAATTVMFGNQNSGFQAGTINGGVSGISFGK